MKITKFPNTMWEKVGQSSKQGPRIKRAWKKEVVCGELEDLRLAGCGAQVTLSRNDYYKKEHFTLMGNTNSFWWRCPCCGSEQPLDTSGMEANNNAPTKRHYLERLRDSLAAELLADAEMREGINYEPAGRFLRSIGIEVDDCLIPDRPKNERQKKIVGQA